MEKAVMTAYRPTYRPSASATDQYRQGTAVNVPHATSSAQSGNFADAAKNRTILLPVTIVAPVVLNQKAGKAAEDK